MSRRVIAVVLALCGVAIAGGWWWSARSPQWNILLITLDTTRADHLGCYGSETALTPNLDRLAAQGVLYEHAYTAVPITLPSHATMLTGLLPPEHGLRINGTSRLPDSVPTLTEILQKEGYRTGAFVSSLVLDERFGLSRGFEQYDDRLDEGPDGPRPERPANETVASAIKWVQGASAEPFFCWVHLYDPHEPYEDHPKEFGDEFTGRPYDAEIAYMDQQIGRLLETLTSLGVDDQTFIVVAGDHGEGLGEHDEQTHGYLAYNSTMHVPLIIRAPGMPQSGSRISGPVSLVDVSPTILQALQKPLLSDTTGRDLLADAEQSSREPRACYGETEAPFMEGGWCPLRTWTTDRWKFIQSTQPELYDLQVDPSEQHNLVHEQAEESAQLGQELADFESTLIVNRGTQAILSEQEQRALASLGYTGGQEAADVDRVASRRDIKETLKYAEQVHECMHMIDRNELKQAQLILEGVVAELPDYPKAWGTLGVCQAKQNDSVAAERCFREALDLDANQNFARIGLGRALFNLHRWEECVQQLEVAVEVEPSALDAQYFLGEANRKLGRSEAARNAFEAAIQIAPGFNEAEIGLADLAFDQGRFDEAGQRYQQLLQRSPPATGALLGRGRLLAKLGRDGDAFQSLQAFLQSSPQNVDGLCEFSQLLATTANSAIRNPAIAIQIAERACQLTNRKEVGPLRTLAMAYASDQKYPQAIASAETALFIAQASDSKSLVPKIEAELNQYRAAGQSPE